MGQPNHLFSDLTFKTLDLLIVEIWRCVNGLQDGASDVFRLSSNMNQERICQEKLKYRGIIEAKID